MREGLPRATSEIVTVVEQIAADAADVIAMLNRPAPAAVTEARDDVRAQLGALVGTGFVTAAGAARLTDVRRYVKGMKKRLEQVGNDPARDRTRMREIHELQAAARKGPDRQSVGRCAG